MPVYHGEVQRNVLRIGLFFWIFGAKLMSSIFMLLLGYAFVVIGLMMFIQEQKRENNLQNENSGALTVILLGVSAFFYGWEFTGIAVLICASYRLDAGRQLLTALIGNQRWNDLIFNNKEVKNYITQILLVLGAIALDFFIANTIKTTIIVLLVSYCHRVCQNKDIDKVRNKAIANGRETGLRSSVGDFLRSLICGAGNVLSSGLDLIGKCTSRIFVVAKSIIQTVMDHIEKVIKALFTLILNGLLMEKILPFLLNYFRWQILGFLIITVGVFYLILGVLTFFDRFSMSIGNALIIVGLIMIFGWRNICSILTRTDNTARTIASICCFIGIILTLYGTSFYGFVIECIGLFWILVLFRRHLEEVEGIIINIANVWSWLEKNYK